MTFESFAEARSVLLWGTFGIALVMGALVNKTNFCTMGAVSDLVNMGDSGRMRAWIMAIAIAILGVAGLEYVGLVNATESFPPYRSSQLIWLENLLGGVLFGIGMTLASGCGNKTLVRIGGGNIKSIMVMVVVGTIAYFMTNPFPGSDQTLMSVLFYDWIRPAAIQLRTNQDLGSLLSEQNATTVRLVVGGIIGLALLGWIFRSSEFRANFDNILGGLTVGAAVVAAWYLSSNLIIDVDGEQYSLKGFIDNWDFLAESEEGKPADTRPLSPQSFTFVNPMGQTLGYLARAADNAYLTFGVMALFGVIAGSFLWSLLSRSFRIEWFASGRDFVNHLIGAVLMGFGGVLAVGCTIGQGVTGLSTLSIGSLIAFLGIVFGSAMTMKVQLYKMMYEGAGIVAILVTSLVDLKLLPAGMRKLDAI